MTRKAPILLVALLLFQSVASAQAPDVAALLDLHNAARARVGRKPLVLDAALVAGAQRNADWMRSRGRLSHNGPFRGWSAENAAWGSPPLSAEAVMRLWLGSPGHRANILGPYSRVGFAKAGGYWCADFR